jgi:hypothetical protein
MTNKDLYDAVQRGDVDYLDDGCHDGHGTITYRCEHNGIEFSANFQSDGETLLGDPEHVIKIFENFDEWWEAAAPRLLCEGLDVSVVKSASREAWNRSRQSIYETT